MTLKNSIFLVSSIFVLSCDKDDYSLIDQDFLDKTLGDQLFLASNRKEKDYFYFLKLMIIVKYHKIH